MGVGEERAHQEQLSWGSSPNLASDKTTLAIRALLLASEVTLGILLKLSVFTKVEIILRTSWSYRMDNVGSWVREACGPQPVPFSLHPIPTSSTLHRSLASIHVVNTVLTSKLCPKPPKTAAPGHSLGGPRHTGQHCQLPKRGHLGWQLWDPVYPESGIEGACAPCFPRPQGLLTGGQGEQLEKD